MLVIPAVDLKGGCCVRLVQGDPGQETIYSSDPVEMARRWVAAGAKRLHVVDLDGAMGAPENNLEVVFHMQEQVPGAIQFGGGLRTQDIVMRVLKKGIYRAIIGTALLKDPAWIRALLRESGDRLMAALDVRDGQVMVEGWKSGSGQSVSDVLKKIEDLGLKEIIYTDIRRDGMLQGPNVDTLRAVLKATKMGVYLSGGISSLDDIRLIKAQEREFPNLLGCIIGKALYTGQIRLGQALAAAL